MKGIPVAVIYEEGQLPDPVSPDNPLAGLEFTVLETWLRCSPRLRAAYRRNGSNRRLLENAARLSVWEALTQELAYRAEGWTLEQAQELTRPAMWTPPRWPSQLK